MVNNHHVWTRRRILASGAAVSAAAVAGCIGGNGDEDEEGGEILDPEEYDYEREEPDDPDAVSDGTMVYTQELERDEDFDPVVSNDAYSFQIITQVFDGLYEFNYEYELEPKVAVDFPEVERDDTRYLLSLIHI